MSPQLSTFHYVDDLTNDSTAKLHRQKCKASEMEKLMVYANKNLLLKQLNVGHFDLENN